ncbi:cyclase family protein [Chloroflexota bacterium]
MVRDSDKNSHVSSGWIDISVPVRAGMVTWPGHVAVQIERSNTIERGDSYNYSHMRMGVHTGTHMDAPLHFIDNRKSIDQMPLDTTIGPARVVEIRDTESIKPEELKPYRIQRGERILFKTRNSQTCWQTDTFIKDYVYITKEAARLLVDAGVRLIGIDYLAVGSFKKAQENVETHQMLLGAEIWLLEGLDLSGVSAGNYTLFCLPLRLVHTEGSPVRAVLRPIP